MEGRPPPPWVPLGGPARAPPAVNELLDRSGDAGDLIVNLHAQLNMLGGLMPMLIALSLALLHRQAGEPWDRRRVRAVAFRIGAGMGAYYVLGIGFAAVAGHDVRTGTSFGRAVAALQPWWALALVPAALLAGWGFAGDWRAGWRL